MESLRNVNSKSAVFQNLKRVAEGIFHFELNRKQVHLIVDHSDEAIYICLKYLFHPIQYSGYLTLREIKSDDILQHTDSIRDAYTLIIKIILEQRIEFQFGYTNPPSKRLMFSPINREGSLTTRDSSPRGILKSPRHLTTSKDNILNTSSFNSRVSFSNTNTKPAFDDYSYLQNIDFWNSVDQGNLHEKKQDLLMPDLLYFVMKYQFYKKIIISSTLLYKEPQHIDIQPEKSDHLILRHQEELYSKITEEEVKWLLNRLPPLPKAFEERNFPFTIQIRFKTFETANNVYVYYGEWNKQLNLRHGRGIHIWQDGSRYEGYWINDKMNEYGKLQHANGDVYEGDFKDDLAHGEGKYTQAYNGIVYVGDWEKDKMNGRGKETWPDGTTYHGDYLDGKKTGSGTFNWSDGSTYTGQVKDNYLNGRGVFQWYDGRKYVGEWFKGKLDGIGEFTWPDGTIYRGRHKEDLKHGYGEIYWANGKIYRGYFENGRPNGQQESFNITWNKGIMDMDKYY